MNSWGTKWETSRSRDGGAGDCFAAHVSAVDRGAAGAGGSRFDGIPVPWTLGGRVRCGLGPVPEVRADRIATLYFFHPLRRLLQRGTAGIPILMYHSISEGEERGNAYFHICTHPRVFREHVKLLSDNGYKTIGLGEAVAD